MSVVSHCFGSSVGANWLEERLLVHDDNRFDERLQRVALLVRARLRAGLDLAFSTVSRSTGCPPSIRCRVAAMSLPKSRSRSFSLGAASMTQAATCGMAASMNRPFSGFRMNSNGLIRRSASIVIVRAQNPRRRATMFVNCSSNFFSAVSIRAVPLSNAQHRSVIALAGHLVNLHRREERAGRRLLLARGEQRHPREDVRTITRTPPQSKPPAQGAARPS
jgi:hypothetical protein